MEFIKFVAVPANNVTAMVETFNLIADGKRNGVIDEQALKELLGNIYSEKFISTKAEAEFWLEKWEISPDLEMPWDFGSWVDAFINAEIELKELTLSGPGCGVITFEQLAWPSGGIDATTQIIKIFGGTIVENSAV